MPISLLHLPSLFHLSSLGNRSRLLSGSVDLFGLVLGLKAGTSHRINAFSVEWMPRPEVVLRNLLSFGVELDGCVETTELLVLLSHAKL